MKVLDVGTGEGEVATIAADFVGPSGMVVGGRHNAAGIEAARERIAEPGHANVTFVSRLEEEPSGLSRRSIRPSIRLISETRVFAYETAVFVDSFCSAGEAVTLVPKAIEAAGAAILIASMLVVRQIVVDTGVDSDRTSLLQVIAPRPATETAGQAPVAADTNAYLASTKGVYDRFMWLYLVDSTDRLAAVSEAVDDWNNVSIWAGLSETHSVVLFSKDRLGDYELLKPYREIFIDGGVGVQIVDLRYP